MDGSFQLKIVNLHHVLAHTFASSKKVFKSSEWYGKDTKQQSENENVKTKKKGTQHRHHSTPHHAKVVRLPIPSSTTSINLSFTPQQMPWWIYNSLPFLFYVVFESILCTERRQTNQPTDRPTIQIDITKCDYRNSSIWLLFCGGISFAILYV